MSSPPHNEVSFLILHYLRSLDATGGNQLIEATNVLERALIDASLLPNLVDYTGKSRVLSYSECIALFPNIQPSYLTDALANQIPHSQIPINTLFTASFNNIAAKQNRPPHTPFVRKSNYSVNAYRRKHSHSLRNIHALLDQMRTLDRPFPLANIIYSVLPKLMRRLKRVVGHHQHVFCAVYDATGDYIVTGSDDHQLKVWSSRTGYLCHTLRGHDNVINDINADPSRRIIVSASRDASIRVWDLVTGENTRVLHTGSKSVNCVLFSPCPDRPYLLSGGDDGIARLWNTTNFDQRCLTIPMPPPRQNRRGLTVGTSGSVRRNGSTIADSFPAQSPPAESIPASSPPRTPSRMSSPPPNLQPELRSPQPPIVTLASRNIQSAFAATSGPASSVAANSGVLPSRPIAQGNSGTRGAGPSRSGTNVGDPRQPLVVQATASIPPNMPLVQHGPVPGNSAQNNSIVSSSPAAQVLSVAFNAGATKLAISGSDCMTHLYSVTKEEVTGTLPSLRWITTLRGHSSKITQVLFSHHGDRLCTASADGTARIYRRINAKPPGKNKSKASCVPGAGTWKNVVLDCRPHNSEVPSTGRADSTSITPRVPRTRVTSCVDAVMWSLNDEYVISASSDGKVRVWNSENGRLVHVLNAHTREVYIMDAHPFDKRVIFTAGYDGKCILWDIEKGVELRRLSTDNGTSNENENAIQPAVTDGKFSPDGMSFCITDKSGALTMFGIPAGDAMLLSPEEQFFANDTLPFRRDAQHRAISQETGQLLHLLPKGDLCDIQLQKHSPEIQIHSRDFYQSLPGAKESQESAISLTIARGEEFRKNEEKEERRLVRIAIDKKRKAMQAKREQELERDELMPVNSMRDFVVPDSDRESDDEFKLEASESEMNTSDDQKSSSEESEEYRPKPRRRKVRITRKRIRKSIAKSQKCTCAEHEQTQEGDGAMSEDESDGSDESFRVESEEADSDASGEATTGKGRKIIRLASRSAAVSGTGPEANVRTSTSSLPRMKIHMSRSNIDRETNGDGGGGPVNSEIRRSPGRSFTSERRANPDEEEEEDKILPQEPPPFSRASSSNVPHRRQWSIQSAANGEPKRRSPRNKGKVEEEETNFDINEISRRELEELNRKDESRDLPIKRGRRKRRTSTRRKKQRKETCPVHAVGVVDSDSDISDGSSRVRKRRKTSNRSNTNVIVEEAKDCDLEWKLFASEWLRGTSEKYNYIPQRGDSVVYYPKGHADAIAKSKEIGIDPKHNGKNSSNSLQRLDGVALKDVVGPLRFTISGVSHEFPVLMQNKTKVKNNKAAHRIVALLTLKRAQKEGWPTCVPNEVALPYFPLDDVPEYVVLTSRVEASIANGWKPGHRFRMLFVNEKKVWSYYSGVVQSISDGMPGLGWNCVQVLYDNEDDPDKGTTDMASPWELEPIVTSRAAKSLSTTARPSMYLAIANEIHQLQACDDLFRSSVSWLDTIQRLSANTEYCSKVALPMDLHIILTRLCTAFYRTFDAFLDDLALLKTNALTYHGNNNETVQMTANAYDCVVKVAQRTRLNMTASTTPPIPGPGASTSSRAARPRTPIFDAAQMGQIGMVNGYRGNPSVSTPTFAFQPPRLPSVGFIAPSSNNHPIPSRGNGNGVLQGMTRLPSVGALTPGSAQATLEVVRVSPGRSNYGIVAAALPPVPAVLAQQQQQQQPRNRLPTRSAQSVEAAGGGHATTSESRVPFYQQQQQRQQQPRVQLGGVMSFQENSRNEHSSISIAAASTMSCGGENVGESTENRG